MRPKLLQYNQDGTISDDRIWGYNYIDLNNGKDIVLLSTPRLNKGFFYDCMEKNVKV